MSAEPTLAQAVQNIADALRDLGSNIFFLGLLFLLFKNMGCRHKEGE